VANRLYVEGQEAQKYSSALQRGEITVFPGEWASVYPSVHPSVYPSVYPSIRPSSLCGWLCGEAWG